MLHILGGELQHTSVDPADPQRTAGALGGLLAAQIRSTQPQAQIKLLLRSGQFARDWIGASRRRKSKEQQEAASIEAGTAKVATGEDQVCLELDRSQQDTRQRNNIQLLRGFDVEWVSAVASTRSEAAKLSNRKRPSGGHGRAIDVPVSASPISTLIITTKAPSVVPSLALLRQRLSAESTVVFMQDGMGILDSVVDAFFSNPRTRPSFVLGLSSQSCHRTFPSAVPRIHWGGSAAEALSYGVIPSRPVSDELHSMFSSTKHPMLNPQIDTTPDLAAHLPLTPTTSSLRYTLETLQLCTELRPTWLSLPNFQTRQLQRLTAVSCINPLSAIGDSLNGHLYGSSNFNSVARQLCQEASNAFYAQRNPEKAFEGAFDDSHPLSAKQLYTETLNNLRRSPQAISSTLSDIRNQSERTEMYV